MTEIVAAAKDYGPELFFFVLGVAVMVAIMKMSMSALQKSHDKAIGEIRASYETANATLKDALDSAMKEIRKYKK